MNDKHVSTISILVRERVCIQQVNQILSEHHDMIMGRIGFPYHEKDLHVISVIVEGSVCDIEGLAAKLDKLEDVCTKAVILTSELKTM